MGQNVVSMDKLCKIVLKIGYISGIDLKFELLLSEN
jgi:hypothetical protein